MGLDTVELVMLVEDRFQIEIPDNEAENIATVQQLIDYTFNKTNPLHQNQEVTKDEIFDIIREIIKKITGLPLTEITRDSAFTNDLGMD